MAKSKEYQAAYYAKHKTTKSGGNSSDYNGNGDFVKKGTVPSVSLSDLPPMTGSEKQISWATQIREQALQSVHNALYKDMDQWNQTVDGRQNAISKNADVSKWGKLKEYMYTNAVNSVKSKEDAAKLVDASLRKFFKNHTNASTIIDVRKTLPSSTSDGEKLIKLFNTAQAKAKSKGKSLTAEQGAEAIKRMAEREGYRFK